MADDWSAFPDADQPQNDPWAGFPDASHKGSGSQRKRSEPQRPGLPVEPFNGPSVPVDGDTLKGPSGSLRVWGIDAPELKQPGYLRNGSTVPVGQQSRNALLDLMRGYNPVIGPSQGSSYGRTVAPLTIPNGLLGSIDVGRAQVRSGNALAEPHFVTTDPDYRFSLIQDERLARQNGLGPINTAMVQPPSEFRRKPHYVVPRETVAVWFDTPTPFQGMRPEVEQEVSRLLNDPSASPDKVAAYARDHGGFVLNPAEIAKARQRSKREKQPIGFHYTQPHVQPLTDPGDGAGGAAVRGFGDEFLAGGLAEAGSIPDALGLTPGRENIWNSDRRFADIVSNNYQQNESILGFDDYAHPYASGVGEVAGALTSGFATPFGQGARTVPQLARVGAAYGGATGFLGTNGSLSDRAAGAAIGATAGAIINPALGEAVEAGAPVLAKGWRALTGKNAPRGSEAAAEAAEGYGEDQLRGSVQSAALGSRAVDRIDIPHSAPLRLEAAPEPVSAAGINGKPEPKLAVEQPGSYEHHAEREERLDDMARVAYRNTLKRIMDADPDAGPEDVLSFSDFRNQFADTYAAAESGNWVARESVNHDLGFEHFPRERDVIDIASARNGAAPKGYKQGGSSLEDDISVVGSEPSQRAIGMKANIPQSSSTPASRPQRLDQPITEAQVRAAAERIQPGDVLPIPANDIGTIADRSLPNFAGSINLEKLETPQDIRRALVQTNARVGFDAATRGRITNAETERLASELNMGVPDLLTRRRGQAFSAEEALAARQLLAKSGNELVNLARKIQRIQNPGDQEAAAFQRALVRHVAIQEQVAGMTAEAGRALQQFKMMANSRAVPGEVLAGIVDAGGGPKRVKEAADMLLDAVEDGLGRFNTAARKAADPRFRDKLAELYINNLVSGPATHVVNTVSNTLTALAQIPEHATAALIGGARKAVARKEVDRVLGGEVGARAFGLVQGASEGARFFARALKTGETSDTFSKIAGHDMRAISGLKGEIVRIPGRLLNAEDEFFKGINRRAEINALAYRQAHKEGLKGEALRKRIAELSANPPENIELKALEWARYMTFQRPLDGISQDISRTVRNHPELRAIITFVRTPANLLRFATERSPAAPILKDWRADFKAGGARRDLAMSKALLGTGFAALIYQAAQEGRVTGSAPADPAKNRYERADGFQPYSICIGDTWYSYSRLDPFATTIGVAADLATKADGMTEKQLDNYSMLLVASIMKQMGDKTWLAGLADFTNALSDPQRYGPSYLRGIGASLLIPNAASQAARYLDPVQRERDNFGEELQARTPGLSDNLLPSRDIWGRPIKSEGGLGPDIMTPIRTSTALHDPVNAAMLAIGARQGPPSTQHTVNGKRVDWTPKQYDRLQELAGQAAYSGVHALISGPAWQTTDNAARLKAVGKVFDKSRAEAKAAVLAQHRLEEPAQINGWVRSSSPPPPPDGVSGTPTGSNDDWSSFPDVNTSATSDPWASFPNAPQRDVLGELQKAIPGIRFTSGYRTPAYQAELKRRGYHPSDNSGHLRGSDIDILPPPGKSLGWAQREVAKVEPNARFLIHDGHLHASFPDWWGAPVLGGAKTQGIVNPNSSRTRTGN